MKYVIGLDEVGRGSLAGPVAVAAVCMPAGLRVSRGELAPLKDSKKLSPKRREEWFAHARRHPRILYVVARVHPRAIERINISEAANLAAARAYRKVLRAAGVKEKEVRIFLDGGLYIGKQRNIPNARTVIKGDEKFTAIKLASIMAKVSRDRYMVRLAKKYPRYGFEIHKGYGTKLHRAALEKHGPSEAHRLTFIEKYYKI